MAYRAEKSLHHVAMEAQYLDLNKPWSRKYGDNIDKYDFPVHDCTRSKTVAQTFLPSFDNANGRFCQEKLLRSRNFATMVTWRHTSPLYYVFTKYSAPMISWSVPGGSENIEVLRHTFCSNIAKKIIRLTGVFVLWFRYSEVPLYRLSSVPLAFSISNVHYIFAIIIAVTTVFLNIILIIVIINY